MNVRNATTVVFRGILLAFVLLLAVANSGAIANFLSTAWSVVQPVVFGLGLAYIINLIMEPIEKRFFPKSRSKLINKLRRPASLLISFFLVLIIIVFVFWLIIPELIKVFAQIIELVPTLFDMIENWINRNEIYFPRIIEILEQFNMTDLSIEQHLDNWLQNLLQMAQGLSRNIVSGTFNTVGSVVSVAINLFVSIMIAIYTLSSKEKLVMQFSRLAKSLMPDKVYRVSAYVLGVVNKTFSQFFAGQALEALITGVLVYVGMLIFRFPYATAISVLTGVMAIIPMIGPLLSGVVGFLLIFVQDPIQAFIFLAFIVVIQQIEGNIIYPRLMGGQLGLSSLWILASVTIFGGLFGLVGMLIGVPITASIYRITNDYVAYKELDRRDVPTADASIKPQL